MLLIAISNGNHILVNPFHFYLQVLDHLFARFVAKDFAKPLPFADTKSFTRQTNLINVVLAERPSIEAQP